MEKGCSNCTHLGTNHRAEPCDSCSDGGSTFLYKNWKSDKETEMNLEKALESVDKMKAICDDGKKEIKSLLYTMANKEEPKPGVKLFNSEDEEMYLYENYAYDVKGYNGSSLCWVENGILRLGTDVDIPGIRTDDSGRILIKAGTILEEE